MLRIYLCLIVCLLSVGLGAQEVKERFYAFKADGSAAERIELATTFMHAVKENDTTYVCRFYQKTGPMFRQESYRDKDFQLPHGRFIWYNAQGNIDSTGKRYEGKKQGYWEYYGDRAKILLSERYVLDTLVYRKDYIQQLETIRDRSSGELMTRQYKDGSIVWGESVQVPIASQSPAEFNGGLDGWKKYLEKNLNIPNRYQQIAGRNSSARVYVNFFVNKEGELFDLYIEKSIEWSVDMESLRVFRNSPKWKPAIQNGQPVVYRHRQSISFNSQ